ncbi:uncharacterized protein N7482_004013 [Penicillium canariense]|uniref:Uncharacterized protein n=1 Tax=Penicillium canariense TaxID=189055 RepID=A0A9W9I5L7_9EURO|nr:uncharacterized protein N7482_004013 [Penicillium canariense]KAJ5168419.1 hypothetical protein N7482_004013 [Penicillium canariense]
MHRPAAIGVGSVIERGECTLGLVVFALEGLDFGSPLFPYPSSDLKLSTMLCADLPATTGSSTALGTPAYTADGRFTRAYRAGRSVMKDLLHAYQQSPRDMSVTQKELLAPRHNLLRKREFRYSGEHNPLPEPQPPSFSWYAP